MSVTAKKGKWPFADVFLIKLQAQAGRHNSNTAFYCVYCEIF